MPITNNAVHNSTFTLLDRTMRENVPQSRQHISGARPARADSALGGRQVAVGDGGQRGGLSSIFAKIKNFFAGSAPTSQRTNTASGVNDYVAALSVPKNDSMVRTPAVMARLMDHAKNVGTSLNEAQITSLVATGERILDSIRDADPATMTLPLSVAGGDERNHSVASNTHTTRAITWALMAQAAKRDVDNADAGHDRPSNLVTEGSIVMKDPGNKLFRFLNSAPVSYSRISTHFNERAPADTPRSTFLRQPKQNGIEDFQNLLPGKKGALLFSKINPTKGATSQEPEIFMKIESGGTPRLFGPGGPGGNIFKSIGRNIAHGLSFIATRFSHETIGNSVERKEHVHKDALQQRVWEPFKGIVNDLAAQNHATGRACREEGDAILSNARKHGVEGIEDALRNFVSSQDKETPLDPDISGKIDRLLADLGNLREEMGGDLGIGRRGAEVHLTI